VVTDITEMARQITLTARKRLTSILYKNLILAKTEKIRDGLDNPDTIVT